MLPLNKEGCKNIHLVTKQTGNQLPLIVKATALKQQLSKFYPQIQRTDSSTFMSVSGLSQNVKASFYA